MKITPEEARAALRTLYRYDRETNLEKAFLHALADELKPINKRGGWNPSSLGVLLAVLICAIIVVFLYFTLGSVRL